MVKHFETANRQLINKVSNIIANQPENTRYQNWLIVFLLLLSFSLTFKKQSIEYFFLNPYFQCDFSPKLVNQNDACGRLEMCTIQNQHTLTVKMGLYCDVRKHERTFIQSLRGIGGWAGALSVGFIADTYGRKICMLISLVSLNVSFLCLIVGALSQNITFFMVSEFLEGVGNKFIFSVSLLYMTRFLRKRMYESITNVWYLIGGGLSHILLALANHFIHHWFLITLISFLPLLALLIAFPYFIKEDPIYLFEEGKNEEFKKEVTWIGEFNGKSREQIEEDLLKVDQIQEERQELLKEIKNTRTCADLCHMFCLNKSILLHTLVLGLIHITCDFTLMGITYSAQSIGFSYNINIAIMGCAQILGSLAMIKILAIEENRKRGFIVTSTVGFLLTLLLFFPFVQNTKIILAIIIFSVKFLITCIFSFEVRVEMDSFPEKLQVSLMSIVEIFSTSHGVIGPSLIQFGVDHHFNNLIFTHFIRFFLGTCPMLLINDQRHQIDHEYVQAFESGAPGKPLQNYVQIQEEIKQQ